MGYYLLFLIIWIVVTVYKIVVYLVAVGLFIGMSLVLFVGWYLLLIIPSYVSFIVVVVKK